MRHFRTVRDIVTGEGALASLGEVAGRLGRHAVLVIGGTSARTCGALDGALSALKDARLKVDIFEGVEAEPTVETVDAIRELARRESAEVVIGLGGGSAMDAAKAAAGLAAEDEPTAVFLHEQKRARPGIPLVTVPTTSGSGAEVTPNAVISDRASKLKASIRNGEFLPWAAVVDPELTLSCPPRVTAHSGLDALCQALESFVSLNATPPTDALSFEAFRLLWGGIERAYTDGTDIEARTACSFGSLLAGIALSNARLGAVHGMAHPIGARCEVPHGLVCAVLLPEVVRMNLAFAAEKYGRIAEITGGDLAAGLEDLSGRLGIYDDFSQFQIAEKDFAVIAEESMPSGSLKANPKKFTEEDVISVLEAVAPYGGGGD